MVPFAGWEMPVQYQGILQEHLAVRQSAGLFDVSHMGEALVSGPQALDFLNHLSTNDIGRAKVGQGIYTLFCQADGGVVDDVIIYRIEESVYLIVLNASNAEKDLAWMRNNRASFDCEIEDVSSQWALLALQGPKAFAILGDLFLSKTVAELSRFGIVRSPLGFVDEAKFGPKAAASTWIGRTGYTGEDGVEIFCPVDWAEAVAELILKAGEPYGLALAGLGCRDSLRLEVGYPLYGHEISETVSPLQAGLGWAVKLGKPIDFIGKAALAQEKELGPARKVLHFVLADRRIARQGAKVFSGDKEVGEVLSGTQSPVLGKPIGSALVCREALAEPLTVDIRGNRIPLEVKRPPLHVQSA